MTKNLPKISVIIPTFNRAHLIGRAIESVQKQTFNDYEIIVVDDGSKDNTQQVLGPYLHRIKYIYQNNQGVSAARNKGIKEAVGEFIAFLDSDDAWAPEKLAVQMDVLEKDPKIGLVHHKLVIFDELGHRAGTKPSRPAGTNFQELVAEVGDLPTSSVLVRKECFDKAGLFDEKMSFIEDYDMWLRIAKDYAIYEIQEGELAYYYRHKDQITNNLTAFYNGLILLDLNILKNFSDIPKDIVLKRLAKNQYTLSRIYFKEKDYIKAFNYLSQAIMRDSLVGLSFADKTDSWLIKIFKVTKTYVYFLICGFQRILKS